jgi:hypothetical protein
MPRRTQSRIESVDLVRGAAVVPEVSEDEARTRLGFRWLLIMVTLNLVVAWVWGWPWLIALVFDIGFAGFIADRANGKRLVQRIHERRASRKRLPIANKAPHGRDTTAAGIRAGTWVCTKEDYQRGRSQYKAKYGRDADDPDVPYQLVLATFPLDGNNQVVAFSDGRSTVWHRARSVIVEDCPAIGEKQICLDDDTIRRTATSLEEVIRLLHEGGPKSAWSIASDLGDEREPEVALALEVAGWWKLIRATDTAQASGSRTASGEGRRKDRLVHLTEAGQDWHLAPDFQARRDKGRRSVQNPRNESVQIKIGTFSGGIVNIAGNDISGANTSAVYHGRPSDDQVLKCLKEILDLREIPWSDSELANVRRVMEAALKQRNPRMSGLKQAVAKLGSVCGDVAVGVLGNGAYQLLMRYFS